MGEPGELEAFETTAIHAKIAGYVKNWTVNIGATVKKGQVLAELSVPELDAELKQKQAAIEQAIAKHKQAGAAVRVAAANVAGAEAKLVEVRAGTRRVEADLARWQSEFRRVEQLHAARAQTGSLLDETRSKLRSSEAACDECEAQIKTADVALTQSRAALDSAHADVVAAAAAIDFARADAGTVEAHIAYTRIEAPFDGIVTQRNVNTGDLTQPGADKPPLFVVARSDIMTIRVNVPEAFAAEVDRGDRAAVRLQEMKGRTVEGKVTRISWALDPKTRTTPRRDRYSQSGRQAPARPVCIRHRHRRRAPRGPDPARERRRQRTGPGLLRRHRRRQGGAPPDPARAQRRHADRGRLGPGWARNGGEGERHLAHGWTDCGGRRPGHSFASTRETLTKRPAPWPQSQSLAETASVPAETSTAGGGMSALSTR